MLYVRISDIEVFYNTAQSILHNCPNQDIVFVAGDFNAKVGANSFDSDICGKYGLGTSIDEKECLIDFCHDNDLYITNTAFQHHKRRIYTWLSPGGRYRNQIDFILIKICWMKCITNARAYPGLDCGSDHNLVGATVKLKVKKISPQTRKIRLNLEALNNHDTK